MCVWMEDEGGRTHSAVTAATAVQDKEISVVSFVDRDW